VVPQILDSSPVAETPASHRVVHHYSPVDTQVDDGAQDSGSNSLVNPHSPFVDIAYFDYI